MRISLEWLNEYVEAKESPERLKDDLTMIGLVVESIAVDRGATLLEIEVTSNRPDCLSYIGIAREVAALYKRPLRLPPRRGRLKIAKDRIPYSIEIRDTDLCPRYVGLVMDGISVGPSPDWIKRRLEVAGMRALNNIVDITNYVLMEIGHPLHAFDFDNLQQGKIVVARATDGQKITTLDGVERQLDGEMLLINDGEGPVAIAGVMGGLNSEISETTRRVLLECAYFQPASIRRTSKKLGLLTEASYRFERGADCDDLVAAIARTCCLLEKLAGGRIAGSLQDVYPAQIQPIRIRLHRDRAEALLGVHLTDAFVESTLKRLHFKPVRKGRSAWEVICPSFRPDMELEADLIEEVARFYGYHNIPTTVPPCRDAGTASPVYSFESAVRRILLGLGYSEAVNLSFAAEQEDEQFPVGGAERLAIRNPLTEETRFMRTTLAPGLVRSAKRNFNYDQYVVRLFEIGKVYHRSPDGGPVERNTLGILGTGDFASHNWCHPSGSYDFFHLKGAVAALLNGMQVADATFVPTQDVRWLDPSSAAALVVKGKRIGFLGALHPSLEEEYRLKQPLYLAEIDFEGLSRWAFQPMRYEQLPKYPFVERDLCFVIAREIGYEAIAGNVRGLGIAELNSVDLIDVYEGEKIPAGKISMTLRLIFQDRERTLTVDRVQGFVDNIVASLRDRFAAELR